MKKPECKHDWQYGYTFELVIFCTKCNKEADSIYKKMPFKEQEKLIIKP